MKKILLAAVALSVVAVSPARAETKYIESPTVHQGWDLHNHGSFQWGDDDNDAWIHDIEGKYGINNHFSVGIGAEISKFEGDNLDYESTELTAKYRFTGDESSLQAAVEGGYIINHDSGAADEIEAKLLLAGSAYNLDHKANLILSHEVGSDSESGIGAAIAWGSYYDMGKLNVGGEYYGDFGNLSDNNGWDDQEHHIGPVVGFNVPVGQKVFDAKLGYLVGLSDASSDNVVKYEMNTEF